MVGPWVGSGAAAASSAQMWATRRRQERDRKMAGVQTREQMGLECLTVLLDLADHRDICIATQKEKRGFCDWEKKKSARYAELIRKIYGGKYARPKIDGETVGECPTNVWFDDAALERAKAK